MSDVQPLVDAHHHVWDLDVRPQPWLDEPGHERIRRSFSSHDLRPAATRPVAGRRLTSTVVVQCVASVPDTRDLLALADSDPLIGAVVGWTDLTSPAIGDVLEPADRARAPVPAGCTARRPGRVRPALAPHSRSASSPAAGTAGPPRSRNSWTAAPAPRSTRCSPAPRPPSTA